MKRVLSLLLAAAFAGASPASQVALTVTDGTFRSSAGHQPLLLTAMADKHVVSGGLFGTALSEDCCAYGYVPVSTPNAEGLYTVTRNALVHSVVFRADGTAVECDSMEQAYNEFYRDGNAKGIIRMLTDMEMGSYIHLAPTGVDMTLDLNGKTLTFTNQTGFDVVRTTNDPAVALTFTVLPEDVAADKALVATLLPYLEAQAVHNVATLAGTTDGGTQTLTLAEIADALEVFRLSDGLVAAEGKALEVAYDFGVASAQVGTDGSLTVVARVQGADGKIVTFAPGTTAQLIDAANAEAGPLAEVALGEDASDTVAFTGVALPEAGKALRLAVRILPPARE